MFAFFENSKSLCCVGFAVLALSANWATAQQTFTNRAEYIGTADSVVVEDFESSPLGLLSAGTNDIGSFNVFLGAADTDETTGIVDFGLVDSSREFQADLDNDHNQELRFDFDQPVFGFGADFGATLTSDLLTLEINNTTYNLDDFFTRGGTGFFGVISEQSFSSVIFGRENPTSSGEFFSIDNVVLATIPEPSCGLFAAAFVSFAIVKRKRRR